MTRKITYIGLLAALTYLCTTIIRIPLPNNAYLHTGDIVIVVAACLFGPMFGALVGGIGSTLADVLVEPVWAPATLIVKFALGLLVGIGYKKGGLTAVLLYLASAVIVVVGYYIAEAVIFGNWIAPQINVLPHLAKHAVSLIAGIIISKRSALKNIRL